ncbi:hypothetical protein LUX12_20790 [Streptomyces somaliensis]|uniref:hypothetical protein n=1 Tax=Streptomyces somaliensis TaxID=78355 RepID=UPI0020CF1A2F|nr:hypothetical protein [Streptomyces somaliensis]MCP9946673.1 hypothetical protein [Streptomyces somaliensis]
MGDLDAPGAPARRFVRAALDGVAPDLVDTAELPTGELVANAVLCARTEVEVSARVVGGGVRVEVGDRPPSRVPVPRHCPPYAAAGRGPALVGPPASRYGVRAGRDAKAVWFELWPGGTPPPSAWEPPAPPPAPRGGGVTLVDVPEALYSAAQRHRHALLREPASAAAGGDDPGIPARDLAARLNPPPRLPGPS